MKILLLASCAVLLFSTLANSSPELSFSTVSHLAHGTKPCVLRLQDRWYLKTYTATYTLNYARIAFNCEGMEYLGGRYVVRPQLLGGRHS